MTTWPARSAPTSSSLGAHLGDEVGGPRLADRGAGFVKASSVNQAASPAPGSTTTSIPSSFDTRSGTRATLRSPCAVSFGTPTFMDGEL